MENRADKDVRAKLLLRTLSDYEKLASDKDLWTTVIFLFNGIISRKLDFHTLIQIGDQFGREDRQNLRAICILGATFLSRQPEPILVQLINIFPSYLTTPSVSITRFIYVPFVRNRTKVALKDLFMGTQVELQHKLAAIDSVEASDQYAIQKIIRIAVEESSLTPPASIIAFLYPRTKAKGVHSSDSNKLI